MQDAWRAYLELALGLTEAPRKKAQDAVRRLVGSGGATAAQLQALAEELVATSAANREALTKLVRFEVDRTLGAVGLATADEVAELTRRVHELERQLREARSGTSTPPAEPAVTPALLAEKTVAKKAVAKKTVAKRTPTTVSRTTSETDEQVAVGPVTTTPAKAAKAPATSVGTGEKATGPDEAAASRPAKKTVAKKTVAKKTVAKKAASRAEPAGKDPDGPTRPGAAGTSTSGGAG